MYNHHQIHLYQLLIIDEDLEQTKDNKLATGNPTVYEVANDIKIRARPADLLTNQTV